MTYFKVSVRNEGNDESIWIIGLPAKFEFVAAAELCTYVSGQHAPVREVRRYVPRLCLQCCLVPPLRLLMPV